MYIRITIICSTSEVYTLKTLGVGMNAQYVSGIDIAVRSSLETMETQTVKGRSATRHKTIRNRNENDTSTSH